MIMMLGMLPTSVENAVLASVTCDDKVVWGFRNEGDIWTVNEKELHDYAPVFLVWRKETIVVVQDYEWYHTKYHFAFELQDDPDKVVRLANIAAATLY